MNQKRSRGASAPPKRPNHYVVRPRLQGFDYVGVYAYDITLVSHARAAVLLDIAGSIGDVLLSSAMSTNFDVLVYTVMPDHLHILVIGNTQQSNAIRFVQRFKQRTSYDYRRLHGMPLWQPSFHDHIMRTSDDLIATARYILDNPRRAGLISAGQRWALEGGTMVANEEAELKLRSYEARRQNGSERPARRASNTNKSTGAL